MQQINSGIHELLERMQKLFKYKTQIKVFYDEDTAETKIMAIVSISDDEIIGFTEHDLCRELMQIFKTQDLTNVSLSNLLEIALSVQEKENVIRKKNKDVSKEDETVSKKTRRAFGC